MSDTYRFMSEGWIGQINAIRDSFGEIEIPDNAKAISLNFTITFEEGEEKASFANGEITAGHNADGKTTLILPAEVAQKLFVERDQSAAVQAFMSGQIKVEGDMSKLMAMQTVQASEKQQALQEQIVEITE